MMAPLLKKDWKNFLDPVLRDYLINLINEAKEYSSAYKSSKNPSIAQLWVALAILNRKIELLESKINKIEEKLRSKHENLDKLKEL